MKIPFIKACPLGCDERRKKLRDWFNKKPAETRKKFANKAFNFLGYTYIIDENGELTFEQKNADKT